MSGETEKQVSAWEVDTLKEHLEAVIEGNDRRYQQRFDAQEAANKYSQEKSNEFRGSLDDIGKKQMPRSEAEAIAKANSEKIDSLAARIDKAEGRSSGLMVVFAVVTALAVIISMIVMLRK